MIENLLHIISYFISSIDLIDGVANFFARFEPTLSGMAIITALLVWILKQLFKLSKSAESVTLELVTAPQEAGIKKMRYLKNNSFAPKNGSKTP